MHIITNRSLQINRITKFKSLKKITHVNVHNKYQYDAFFDPLCMLFMCFFFSQTFLEIMKE